MRASDAETLAEPGEAAARVRGEHDAPQEWKDAESRARYVRWS